MLDVSAIAAQAGTIDIAAAQAMRVSGRIFANGVVNDPSQIVANALGGSIQLQTTTRAELTTAVLDASGEGGGGRIHIQAEGVPAPINTPADNSNQMPIKGAVLLSTNTVLRANSARAHAGRVEVEGDHINLETATLIEAKGATQGGTVLIGGDWQGGGTLRQATTVAMSADSTIDASATDNGDGGQVVLWSAIDKASSVTSAYGTINAKAGANGGNGGRIETSGHLLQVDGALVNASASKGQGGEWLLDPYNITITSSADSSVSNASNTFTSNNSPSNINVSTITGALNSGTSVTVQTGAGGSEIGDLQVNTAITKTAGSDATLTLKAHNNVVVSGAITSNNNKLHINLISDSDQNGAGVVIINSNLTSNGGDIAFGTGSTISFGGVTTQVGGDVYVTGSSAVTWTTGGGALTVNGQTLIGNPSGLTVNTSGGTVLFGGSIDSANSYLGVTATYDWTGALAAAKSGTGANTGDTYLATITTRLENAIASQAVNYQSAWLGARRVTGLGTDTAWRWVAGPEGLQSGGNGAIFFYQTTNGSGGSTVGGYFSNWSGSEPNNWTGGAGNSAYEYESVMQFTGALGQWNDLPKTVTNLSYYVKETNATPSALTINSGAGSVALNGSVGSSKALSSLTINSAGLTASAINTTTSLNITNSAASSITGSIMGAGSLTKAGAGTLTLSGTSDYTGSTTLNAGTLKISSTGQIYQTDITTNLNVNSGAVLDINTWSWQGSLGKFRFDPPNLVINGGTVRYSGSTGGDWRSFTVLSGGATFDSPTSGVTWSMNNSAQNPVISGDLTFTGAGNIVLNHNLTGSGYSIIKNGSGTLTLGGNNTYTGATLVNAGTLSVASSTGLGSTASGTTVASGAALEFTGGITVADAISVTGTGVSSAGALRNLSGVNAVTGLVTLTGNTEVQSDAGSLTFMPSSGNAFTGNYNLTFDGAGTTMSGALGIGTGSLTKQGTGTFNLLTANNYTGNTTLSGGTLGVYDNASISTGTLTAAGGTTVMFGRGVNNFANNMTLNGSVTFDLDSTVDYLLVGGGGGGGGDGGPGGGGGAIRNITGADVGSTTSFALSVGAGGGYGLWGSNSA